MNNNCFNRIKTSEGLGRIFKRKLIKFEVFYNIFLLFLNFHDNTLLLKRYSSPTRYSKVWNEQVDMWLNSIAALVQYALHGHINNYVSLVLITKLITYSFFYIIYSRIWILWRLRAIESASYSISCSWALLNYSYKIWNSAFICFIIQCI